MSRTHRHYVFFLAFNNNNNNCGSRKRFRANSFNTLSSAMEGSSIENSALPDAKNPLDELSLDFQEISGCSVPTKKLPVQKEKFST